MPFSLMIYDIFRYVAENLVLQAKGDAKNGNSAELNKKVVLFDEMTMGQIMAGFPDLIGIPYQLFAVFLVSEIDQLTERKNAEDGNMGFIGDISANKEQNYRNASVAYQNVVTADNLGYVFEKTIQYFEDDDFTMANFECVLSDYDVPADKNFTFRAPPSYVDILTLGSVEFVTLGNNHVEDYGEQGYADTKATLDAAGIGYASRDEYTIYETESGLKIGVYADSYGKVAQIQAGIAALTEAGAEFIIAALHWGDEGAYDVNALQLEQGHAAIDAGADVVYGSHPHTLQPIEVYNDHYIFYSMGNWSFGGKRSRFT